MSLDRAAVKSHVAKAAQKGAAAALTVLAEAAKGRKHPAEKGRKYPAGMSAAAAGPGAFSRSCSACCAAFAWSCSLRKCSVSAVS